MKSSTRSSRNSWLNRFSVKKSSGVIWYQGENNAIGEESVAEYEEVLSTMITDWRRAFAQPEMPFLIVQLPNFGREGGIFNYAAIRDIQHKARQGGKTERPVWPMIAQPTSRTVCRNVALSGVTE